jgi:hypothetical protein
MKKSKKVQRKLSGEEEYQKCGELENDLDRQPFDRISKQYNLLGRLSHKEHELLWRLFLQANAVRFFVSAPRRSEQQTTREESYFVTLRGQLFSTPGWKQLPIEVRDEIKNCLLGGWEESWSSP